ncbi:Rab5 interacting [Micractinium conductrix]|uniref:Rab5 interacting n=1 Tax=Micractinium conductrix TaxID=554055 RepID=A0A2P6VDV9_9CHLO|nr:Rab5 interacting [Micractinium conductrix]|eukprot:PSC72284.1 Rab5 interacting [Micractinium conductrix]
MRPLALLRKAITPPPQAWPKNDLYDALFFVRFVVAVVLGTGYGAMGAQGLIVFLSFLGINIFVGNAWLKFQQIDESEYEDPEKISQSPLSFEGFAPSLGAFVLMWVTVFTLTRSP